MIQTPTIRAAAAALLLAGATLTVGASAEPTTTIPDSLGAWYKPQNQRQVWLHTMFSLRRELQAVQEYAAVDDAPRLEKWARRLAEHYRSIPKMVPEWADEVDLAEADALERAATAGDAGATASAADRLARSCRSCHREYRALAAARFRAPDFGPIRVTSGGVEIAHPDFMEGLSDTLNRVKIASEDDRWPAATEAAMALRGRLADLGGTCAACHSDPEPRERILGSSAQATLDRLDEALAARKEKEAGRVLGEAAVQVCARCHGVHRTLSDLTGHLFPQ